MQDCKFCKWRQTGYTPTLQGEGWKISFPTFSTPPFLRYHPPKISEENVLLKMANSKGKK